MSRHIQKHRHTNSTQNEQNTYKKQYNIENKIRKSDTTPLPTMNKKTTKHNIKIIMLLKTTSRGSLAEVFKNASFSDMHSRKLRGTISRIHGRFAEAKQKYPYFPDDAIHIYIIIYIQVYLSFLGQHMHLRRCCRSFMDSRNIYGHLRDCMYGTMFHNSELTQLLVCNNYKLDGSIYGTNPYSTW